jgi:YggT family protein
MSIICFLLTVYTFVLLASVILSWVMVMRPPSYSSPGRKVIDAIFAVTNPVFGLVRGVLPPIRMGGAALDLSPIIVFIVLSIVTSFVCRAI